MLKVEDLHVAVGDKPILKGVNLHIKPGETHVLFGPNGSGKSTLLGAVMGFARFKVTNGRIFLKERMLPPYQSLNGLKWGSGLLFNALLC